MAVLSDTFGGLRLSGTDARKFDDQVRYGKKSESARVNAALGRKLADAFLQNGSVKIDIKVP